MFLNQDKKYLPPIAIPPGDTLLELLITRGITQRELAKRMGRPVKTISEIVKGKTTITSETAIQLEQVFSIPAEFWNNLEANYQETKARLKNIERLKGEVKESMIYPYEQMAIFGWLPKTKDALEKAINLLSFFGTTSFENVIEKDLIGNRLFRISTKKEYSRPAIISWLRKGIIDSQKANVVGFDKSKLREALPEIKRLSLEHPSTAIPRLKDILANCGVSFIITPNLKNAPINGVSFWLSPNKAMIQLSLRNKYADIFWFSLFHEIGHLLLHDKKETYIDMQHSSDAPREQEADKFACDSLISPSLYFEFINKGDFSKNSTISFAHKLSVDCSIVIGRLQHDKYLPHDRLNDCRTRYEWVVK